MIQDHTLLNVKNYILVVDERKPVDHALATSLWHSGAPCYSATSEAEFDVTLAKRDDPDLLILRLDEASTSMIMRLEHFRLHRGSPLLCILPEQWNKPEIHAILQVTDDFLITPIHEDELHIRARRLLKHPVRNVNQARTSQEVSIDLGKRQIARNNRLMTLSPTEVKILAKLGEHNGEAVPFEELVTCIDAPNYQNQLNALRVHVRRLRQKLESNPKQPEYLVTARGTGYQLSIPPQAGCVINPEATERNETQTALA